MANKKNITAYELKLLEKRKGNKNYTYATIEPHKTGDQVKEYYKKHGYC